LLSESPTALQVLVEEHDTPARALVVAPAGLGVEGIVQLVPFQLSASGTSVLELSPESPTAVQALTEGHDTASSGLYATSLGLGVDWIAQLVPFQLSASVVSTEAVKLSPTAVQTLLDGHDTPSSSLVAAPAGLGVDGIVQLVPFQLSASVNWALELLT
jgi:hypothetical protein